MNRREVLAMGAAMGSVLAISGKAMPSDKPDSQIAGHLKALRDAMKADPHYGWTWHCNVACCFLDEGAGHRQANEAAARFMKLAFDYDSTKQDEWKSLEKHWKSKPKSKPSQSRSDDEEDNNRFRLYGVS